MFLIDAIKHNVDCREEIQNLFFFFTRLFRRGLAYKIKPVLFLFVLCFLAATKTLIKTNEKLGLKGKI